MFVRALVVVALSLVPLGTASAETQQLVTPRHANTWDVNLDLGYGYAFGDARRGGGLARGRFGVLLVRDAVMLQFGGTAEWTTIAQHPAFGAQGEVLHVDTGAWFQLGGAIDTAGKPGGMMALGLSLFGVEAELRQYAGYDGLIVSVYGKLRIPVGILAYAASRP